MSCKNDHVHITNYIVIQVISRHIIHVKNKLNPMPRYIIISVVNPALVETQV